MADRPDFHADLLLATEAARAAGEGILRAFEEGVEVSYKGADQPVTAADLEADRYLRETLRGARPAYGWLSEETADDLARLDHSTVWLVDPIDGTNSFIEGRPEFAVSIGLAHDGIPVVGVVYNPATGEMYQALRGDGARLNGERIHVRAAPAGEELPCLVCSRSERMAGDFRTLEEGWALTELGSTAYKMARVADGTFQGYVSARRKHEWDVCAAALITEEAGGEVLTLEGQPLLFNRTDPWFHGVAAIPVGAEQTRQQLLNHLRSLFMGEPKGS